MADEAVTTPDGAGQTTATSIPPGTGTDGAAPDGDGADGVETFTPSKKEWVDSRREIRELKILLRDALKGEGNGKGRTAPEPKAKPEDSATAVAEMRAEFEFRDHLDGVEGLTTAQRNLIKRLHKSERPADVGEWLDGALQVVRGAAPTAKPDPKAAPPPKVEGIKTDTGAAGSAPIRGKVSAGMDLAEWRGMSMTDKRAAFKEYVQKDSGITDKYNKHLLPGAKGK